MKKIIFSAVAVGTLLSLFGCNNPSDSVRMAPETRAAELKPMQQSFRGVLPCADCEGIETSLFLEKDGTWVMNERGIGAKMPDVSASWGSWARTADKLVLTDAWGNKRYFRPDGEGLEMLDQEGNPIESALNYRLESVQTQLPKTPMAMKGKYMYMADAATFTDCATGRTFIFDNNIQMERAYSQARDQSMQPVLVKLEAHFTLTPNPDSGEMQMTVVPDSDGRFSPGKDCND